MKWSTQSNPNHLSPYHFSYSQVHPLFSLLIFSLFSTLGSEEVGSPARDHFSLHVLDRGNLDHPNLGGQLERLSKVESWLCPEGMSNVGNGIPLSHVNMKLKSS
jgi:hypothetical protein